MEHLQSPLNMTYNHPKAPILRWRASQRLAGALAALFLLSTAPAPAQNHADDAEVSVTLRAAEELVVNGVNDLDFGIIISGAGRHAVVLTDPSAGLFTITGRSNRRVTVTLSPPAVLTNAASGNTIPFTSAAAYRNHGTANNNPAGATVITGNSTTFRIFPAHTGRPIQATAYVWIYGEINVGNVRAGPYTGIFTLTADFGGN